MRGLPDPSFLPSCRGFFLFGRFCSPKETSRHCSSLSSVVTVALPSANSLGCHGFPLFRLRDRRPSQDVCPPRAGELGVLHGASEAIPSLGVVLFPVASSALHSGTSLPRAGESQRISIASSRQTRACSTLRGALCPREEETGWGLSPTGRQKRGGNSSPFFSLFLLFQVRKAPLSGGQERHSSVAAVGRSSPVSLFSYAAWWSRSSSPLSAPSPFRPSFSSSFQWICFPYPSNACPLLWTPCVPAQSQVRTSSDPFRFECWCFSPRPSCAKASLCGDSSSREKLLRADKATAPSRLPFCPTESAGCLHFPSSPRRLPLMPRGGVAAPGPCTPASQSPSPASPPSSYPLSPLSTDAGGGGPSDLLSQVPPAEGLLSPALPPPTRSESGTVTSPRKEPVTAATPPPSAGGTSFPPAEQEGGPAKPASWPTVSVEQRISAYEAFSPGEVALANPACTPAPPPSFSAPFCLPAQQTALLPFSDQVLTPESDRVSYRYLSPRPASFPPPETSLRQHFPLPVYTRTESVHLTTAPTTPRLASYSSSLRLATAGPRGSPRSPPPPAPYNVNGRYWPSSSSEEGTRGPVVIRTPPVETGGPAAVYRPCLYTPGYGGSRFSINHPNGATAKRDVCSPHTYAPGVSVFRPQGTGAIAPQGRTDQTSGHPAISQVSPFSRTATTIVAPRTSYPPFLTASSIVRGAQVTHLHKTGAFVGPSVRSTACYFNKHAALDNGVVWSAGRPRCAAYLACCPRPARMPDHSLRNMEASVSSRRRVQNHEAPSSARGPPAPKQASPETPSSPRSPNRQSPAYDVFKSASPATQQDGDRREGRRRAGVDTGPSPELIREKLHKVMDVPNNFLKSARASFK